MSRFKLSEMTVGNDFPEVVLYHGTYTSYIPSISQMGIVPVAFDIEKKLDAGMSEISSSLRLSPEQEDQLRETAREYATQRLSESGFEMVYLSGERQYAVSNAGASAEWFEGLLHSALRMKFHDEIDAAIDMRQAEFQIQDRLKELDNERHSISPEQMGEFYHKVNLWESALREAEGRTRTLSEPLNEKMREIEQKLKAQKFGEQVSILTVKMPYDVFKSKVVSPYSKERVALFEKLYREYKGGKKNWFYLVKNEHKYDSVWEFFKEIRLSGIEPEYIEAVDNL